MKTETYKLSKPDLNLIERLNLPLADEDQTRANKHTGAVCVLSPLQAALYDFIYDAQADGPLDSFDRPPRVTYLGRRFPIRDWDRARLLFRKRFPYEYYELVD